MRTRSVLLGSLLLVLAACAAAPTGPADADAAAANQAPLPTTPDATAQSDSTGGDRSPGGMFGSGT